jgi:hypothetical protein
LALRSLRDCGLIRASLSHPGFNALALGGLVYGKEVPNEPGVYDFSLNDRGVALAAQLKPWAETR